MKKKLLVLAVGAAMAAPAMADVSIYGRAHVYADYLDVKNQDVNSLNLSSNASRIGFKAEDTFGDITAFMQLEQEYNTLQGNRNQAKSQFATRNTFVGVKGDWGMVRAGRFDTPFKAARGPANLFANQVGDMRVIFGSKNDFDNRNDNTIHIQSPSYEGLQFNLAYSVHEGEENIRQGAQRNDQSYSFSATYEQGIFDAALAYEKYEASKADAIRLAGAAQLTDELKAVAFYQHNGSEGTFQDANIYGVGAEFALIESTSLKGMYMGRDGKSSKDHADLVVVGVEHRIADPLRVYANYAYAFNKGDAADVTPWSNGGRSNSKVGYDDVNENYAFGEDAQALSVGLRYDF